MNFADLGLSEELLKAVEEAGYSTPTPIQAQAIPSVLMMRDILGIAQTGTGKTASFVLPMIDILAHGRSRARMPRSLILEPTRELAAQVAENFEKYGKNHKLSMALLIGGVSMGDQLAALEKGVDVLIATPGRLMDLFERGKIMLNGCSMLVIDEADRMLDMGFIPDIENICTKLPAQRQTLLFSATMPAPIKKLADRFLSNPKSIEVARPATASSNITQWLVNVDERAKRETIRQLLKTEEVTTAIIFCNRKTMVRDLNTSLKRHGFSSGEIHGDMDQSSRIAELDRFKNGGINILVASDVAARGLDVKGVSHVFNFDAPWHPDDYVHRIGRTGRAGATGTAYTFVTKADAEALDNIQKLIGTKIPPFEVKAEAARSGRDDSRGEPRRDRSRNRRDERPRDAQPVEEAVQAEPVREEAPRQEAPREEVPREARPPRDQARNGRAREERAREDRPRDEEQRDARPRREGRGERDRNDRNDRDRNRPSNTVRNDANHVEGPDEGWNGPVPEFLNFGFGGSLSPESFLESDESAAEA
ncbi:DEAD/DEAH box helicase [Sphingobium sufflavum]|uniref:DEAD/DEAH box helicase n=1 Tax=Sphingobium sufflavum TaxID=1129547 RepID=UPI001F1D4D7F|nr:DEAD/DEAH box helicase [Sphingobium sufflavum]MCE7797320.1 DEAD/DEAH box helicase [Sphingobium sufflavum]